MRIETNNRTSGVGKGGSAGRSGSGVDFIPAGGEAPARVASAAPMAGMTGIDAILALQAVDGPLEGKKKSLRRGRSLLDTLDEIKADLLVGRVSVGKLDALVGMLAEVRERSLPDLDAVLDDIELRVRVELAKFGRFPAA
ncbi:flagellar assembly protein FliX [Devosia sp. SL43]|uniref:flagellar assembly protein FliX n=1 Tax=Devosia sp. SL43 TaxID=2806348 RepID=UPI001F1A9AAD|nr:flagellar assembly protein FliX [Devosia sp. SL43]UJW86640.1 flagellar assembly protein FliX [Devosia sp. SL43]